MEAAPNREHIRNMAEARAHVKRDGGCYIRPINSRDYVAAKMTPAQIAEAQKMASEWKPK